VELGPETFRRQKEASRYAQAGAAAPTLQATDLAGPAGGQTDRPATSPLSGTQVDQPTRIALSKEMQEKLRQMEQRAAEMQNQRQATAPAATQPVPAAVPERAPAASEAFFGQSAGRPDSDPALQPGQLVPSTSERISESPAASMDTALQAAGSPAATETGRATEACYEPGAFPNGDQVIDVTLPPQIPIIQLLDLAGKYLNLSYIYDPAKVTGDVTLKLNGRLQGQMKVKDLYPLVEEALQSKDLVMTRRKDNIVRIVPKTEATSIDPKLVSPDSRTIDAGDAIVTRVFSLKYIDTTSAENFLNQMGLSISVTSVADSGTLIVTAYSHRMARIEQLLEMVDKPGEPRKFRFRQLRYTMAQTLAEKVKALAEQLESVTITVGTDSSQTPMPTVAKLAGETEAAYRARLARVQAAQAAARAAAEARNRATGATSEQKPSVYLDADERTNRILMIGLDEQLDVVEDLVDTLDVEQQDLRTLELYRIRHMDAAEVAQKLQELGIISKVPESSQPGRITGSSRTNQAQLPTSGGRPVAPTPELPTATEVTEGGIVGEPQVVVVESTNSLLVNATAEQHAQIATIIEYVDSEMLADEIPYKIYPLENSSPDHLAEVLESLIQETIEQQNPEGKIETKVVSREQKIKIVPDPNTYSLIVYASKKNQDWISSLVKQLDKRRPQVLIDATLVEISKVDAFTYDLQMISKLPSMTPGDSMQKLGVGNMALIEPFPSNVVRELSSALGDGGSAQGFYGDRHIEALVKLMQTKGYGRVLAKPKILVNDNEKGHIDTTNTIYVSRSSQTVVTSTGGTQPPISTSFQFDEFPSGIMLDITPHISEGNLLRLEITMNRSSQPAPEGGIAQNEPPPNKTENNIETIVTVPDKSTIILGGIITLDQNKDNWKVPLLGDIPLVGGLFRKIDNSSRETKLYVFVKAHILRPNNTGTGFPDLETISQENRTGFEESENEFQHFREWPGIKGRPVSPPKVLDVR
jgi:general secretion pathway protein D